MENMKEEIRVWWCVNCSQIFDITHPDIKIIRPPDGNHCLVELERRAHSLIFTTNKALRDRMDITNHSLSVLPQRRVDTGKRLDEEEAQQPEEKKNPSLDEILSEFRLGEKDADPQ